jgi:predicted  nucleic acid-binding Zn-ribbon protein
MKSVMALILFTGLLSAATVSADTVYSWTDEQGVQRFSNDPPPEGIEFFKKFESPTPPQNRSAVEERRSSYDQMVRKASEETLQLEQQREAEAAAQATEKKRMAEAQRKEKIQNERNRLDRQIEAIAKRALSPTYTQGMKQALINEIKKQIAALENNPDTAKPQQQRAPSESNSGY